MDALPAMHVWLEVLLTMHAGQFLMSREAVTRNRVAILARSVVKLRPSEINDLTRTLFPEPHSSCLNHTGAKLPLQDHLH